METVTDFIFLGSKLTVNGDCSHEVKRHLLLGRKWKCTSLSHVWLFATPWLYSLCNSPGQNTEVGSLSLLQQIFLTQESNRYLLHCRWILYQLSYQGSLGGKAMNKTRQSIKEQRHHFASKGLYSQSYGFSSSHIWMWELDHKEGWDPKNWCFLIVVLKKTRESPLDCKEIKPVNPKGNQPWILVGRTDAEAPIFWPPEANSQLVWKDPDAGKDWRQEEKGTTEDEIVGWHHRPNWPEFEQTLRDSEGQGSLACCSLWGRRVRHDWATKQQAMVKDGAGAQQGVQAVNTQKTWTSWCLLAKHFYFIYF